MKLGECVDLSNPIRELFRPLIDKKSRTKYLIGACLITAGIIAIEKVTISKVDDVYTRVGGAGTNLPTYLKVDYIRSQTNYQPNFWVEMADYYCHRRK